MLRGTESDLVKLRSSSFLTFVFLLIPIGLALAIVMNGWALLAAPLIAWPISTLLAENKARKHLDSFLYTQKYLVSETLSTEQSAGYFFANYAHRLCAIAFDPASNVLQLILPKAGVQRTTTLLNTAESAEEYLVKLVLKPTDITGVAPYDPGVSLYEIRNPLRTSSEDSLYALRQNQLAKQKQGEARGLVISTNILMHPQITVSMPYEDAQKWTLLVKQFAQGSLQPVDKFTEFPQEFSL
jgi:hypothetical protein